MSNGYERVAIKRLFSLENISQNGCIYLSLSLVEYDTVKWRSENIMKRITRENRRLYSVRTNFRCKYIVNGWLIDSKWSKRNDTIFVMMGSIVIFLSLSFFFFQRVKVMRDKLEGNECE